MSKDFNTNTHNKEEWLTPPYIIESLGVFDLDPCSPLPDVRPWDTAKNHYSTLDNGLRQEWYGRVWCNPPYGRETFKWMEKLHKHGNGIGLIFARTETIGFHEQIWNKADAIFFFKGRLKFHHISGKITNTANAPSCLVVYGKNNIKSVKTSGLKGKLITLNPNRKVELWTS